MSEIVSFDSLMKTGKASATAPEASKGGCSSSGKTSCGSSSDASDLPAHIWEKVKDHPCYSEQAHHYFARMHVAVAPGCNIQCNYCNRKYDCSNESRPGVVSQRLSPEQALDKVLAVAEELPQLSVVGIAGPGDALANAERTFRTFDLIAAELPDIKLCLSTNGMALPENVDRIAERNVDHVTITMNALDPEIGAKIYPWVVYKKKKYTGVEGAEILIEQQLKGLDALVAKGVLVKVNSVMIPGINDEHLRVLNKEIKKRGAFLHNIMPLISKPEFGTVFGLQGQAEPTPQELRALQEDCTEAKLMKHCRQCRADAVGLLGEDRNEEFTPEKVAARVDKPEPDQKAREIYRKWVEKERAARDKAEGAASSLLAGIDPSVTHTVAVTTKQGNRINQHFGHAGEYQVYTVSAAGVKSVGIRRVDNYCKGGHDEDDAWPSIFKALEDVDAILTAKIGRGPRKRLEKNAIAVIEDYALDYIEEAIAKYFAAAMAETETDRAGGSVA